MGGDLGLLLALANGHPSPSYLYRNLLKLR